MVKERVASVASVLLVNALLFNKQFCSNRAGCRVRVLAILIVTHMKDNIQHWQAISVAQDVKMLHQGMSQLETRFPVRLEFSISQEASIPIVERRPRYCSKSRNEPTGAADRKPSIFSDFSQAVPNERVRVSTLGGSGLFQLNKLTS